MATSLWQAIHDDLRRRIESGELAVGATLPSETDLASHWEVSRLTAHRALYELQRSGLVLRKRRVGTVVSQPQEVQPSSVAAIFYDASDYFQGKYLASINASMAGAHHVVYLDSDHDHKLEAQVLRKAHRETEGIILFPTCHPENDPLLAKLSKVGPPLVCIDRVPAGLPCDAVTTDNYGATTQGLQFLASNGHRRIAHITDNEPYVSSTHDRAEAYHDFMRKMGQDSSELFRQFPYVAPFGDSQFEIMVRMVQDALTAMLHSSDPPTAVLCLRDHYAAAVDEALYRIDLSQAGQEKSDRGSTRQGKLDGARRPRLEVLAFIDRPTWMLRLRTDVHRIQQDVPRMGQIAAERLRKRIAGEILPVEHFKVPAVLIPSTSAQPVLSASV